MRQSAEQTMDFEFSPKVQSMRESLLAFMGEYIYPNEGLFLEQVIVGNRPRFSAS